MQGNVWLSWDGFCFDATTSTFLVLDPKFNGKFAYIFQPFNMFYLPCFEEEALALVMSAYLSIEAKKIGDIKKLRNWVFYLDLERTNWISKLGFRKSFFN